MRRVTVILEVFNIPSYSLLAIENCTSGNAQRNSKDLLCIQTVVTVLGAAVVRG